MSGWIPSDSEFQKGLGQLPPPGWPVGVIYPPPPGTPWPPGFVPPPEYLAPPPPPMPPLYPSTSLYVPQVTSPYTSVPPPVYPLPGGMPYPTLPLYDPAADVRRGKEALDQLRAKHNIFAIQFLTGVRDQDEFYRINASTLETVKDLALPLSTDKINGMFAWLQRIDPTRRYSPSECADLIRKLILRERVAFPSIDLPFRLSKFLKKAMREITPAESFLETEKQRLRSREWELLKELQAAKFELEAAQKATYTSEYQNLVNQALYHIQQVEQALESVRKEMDATQSELDDKRRVELSGEQLLVKILSAYPDPDLRSAYELMKQQDLEALELLKPYQAGLSQLLSERLPLVNKLTEARSYELKMMQSGSSLEIEAAKEQRLVYQNLIAEIEAKMEVIYTNRNAAMKARPDLFPNPSEARDPEKLLTKLLDSYLETKPFAINQIVQGAMERKSKDVDSRIQILLSAREAEISETQKALDMYIRVKAEAEMKPYQDQFNIAQKRYNDAVAELQFREKELSLMQNQITTNIERLSGVIGWAAHQNKMTDETMKQVWFINMILNLVANANGAYDQATFTTILAFTTTEKFWKEEGISSSEVARQTQDFMKSLEQKKYDYDYGEGKRIRDEIEKLIAWLKQLQTSYEITYRRVNSEEYVKQAIAEFKRTPEQLALKEYTDQISRQIRDLTALIQYEQEQFQILLEDIEEETIERQGIDIPDVDFLPYEEKKAVWFGVKDHLEKKMPMLPKLEAVIDELQAKASRGEDTGDLGDLAAVARLAILNLQGAQLIYRKLERDPNLKLMILKEEEEEAQRIANLIAGS